MKKYLTVLFILINSFLGALSLTPGSWDLGSIVSFDGVQNKTIDVFNNTNSEVTVNFISTCDCLTTDTQILILSPHESTSVLFSFDPIDETGSISKFMIIRTSEPGLPKALFEVFGEVQGNSSIDKNLIQTEDNPVSVNSKVITIKYYYSAGCISCRRFLESTIPSLEEKLDINIEVESFDILDSVVYEEYFSRLQPEEVKNISFPALFIGDRLLQGDKVIALDFEEEVVNYTGAERDSGGSKLIDEISISLFPVLLAGLLDGINPCVFTSLLFLISSLTLAGRGRKEILIIGVFYTIAVFVTYYLVGLGLFQGLRSATVFPLISDIIKWVLISFLLIISMLSFYDFLQIKKGKTAKISLQLPKFLKLRIHSIIREQVKTPSIVLGALTLGVMVSIFELACTGQVYFPTIAYLVKLGSSSAYIYLLIYNISFIIPLFIVFVLIYKGTGSKAITGFFLRKMGMMKISLSLLFLILAGVTLFI